MIPLPLFEGIPNYDESIKGVFSIMQCANCDREVSQEGSQFCPFCATPLHLVDSPKKKKNEEVQTYRNANENPGSGDWLIYTIFGVILLCILMAALVSPVYSGTILIVGLPISIGVFLLYVSNRCDRCGGLFSMQRVSHERLGSKKIYQMQYGKYPRQIVVLRINWKDQHRCSRCGCEKQRIYTKDYDSFSE